ncbi:MAG: hypothetical protein JSR77_18535 [Planctomycetes bacterium]|nr:hypothetical protein [Planctomycetota bacterium]
MAHLPVRSFLAVCEALEPRLLLQSDASFTGVSASASGSGAEGVIVAGVDLITVNATIFNRGDDRVKGWQLAVVLVPDFDITDEKRTIGNLGVPLIEKRASWNASGSFLVPRGIKDGEYDVFLRVVKNGLYTSDANDDPVLAGYRAASGDPNGNNTRFTGLRVTISGTATTPDPGEQTGGVRLNLSGSGSARLQRRGDGDFDVIVSGTTKNSRLTIENAGGFTHIRDVRVLGSLNTFEMKVPLTGDLTIEGTAKEIRLRYVKGSAITVRGTGEKLRFHAKDLYGSSIISGEHIETISVLGWYALAGNAGVLEAPGIRELTAQASVEAGVRVWGTAGRTGIESLKIADDLASPTCMVRGPVEKFDIGGLAERAAATVQGRIKKLEIRGDASGVISASEIQSVKIKRGASGLTLLAGAYLGEDARLGGEGLGGDVLGPGIIGTVEIKGTMVGSVVGAGLNPANSVIGDGDDRFVTIPGSRVDKITVGKRMLGSAFYSPRLPGKASVNGKSLHTAGDPRFISVLG